MLDQISSYIMPQIAQQIAMATNLNNNLTEIWSLKDNLKELFGTNF